MKQINQKITAGGIIIKNFKVLIIQRSADEEAYPNLWEVPSGKKESMEKIEETVTREVFEETGLEIDVISIVDTFNYIVEKVDETRDVTQINFLLKLIGSLNITLSNEHQKFAWIEKDELDKYNLSDETKASIKKALQMRENI